MPSILVLMLLNLLRREVIGRDLPISLTVDFGNDRWSWETLTANPLLDAAMRYTKSLRKLGGVDVMFPKVIPQLHIASLPPDPNGVYPHFGVEHIWHLCDVIRYK